MIGSIGTHIWESLFIYLHPVMGVGFHLHYYYMLPIAGAFYIESFCAPGIMKKLCEEQYELTIMLKLL